MPSTVIKRFQYEEQSGSLLVWFLSGKVYRYKEVPGDVVDEMKKAFSKGTYFNKYVKGRFAFERVEEDSL